MLSCFHKSKNQVVHVVFKHHGLLVRAKGGLRVMGGPPPILVLQRSHGRPIGRSSSPNSPAETRSGRSYFRASYLDRVPGVETAAEGPPSSNENSPERVGQPLPTSVRALLGSRRRGESDRMSGGTFRFLWEDERVKAQATRRNWFE